MGKISQMINRQFNKRPYDELKVSIVKSKWLVKLNINIFRILCSIPFFP